jgi:C-terminal processing protease CtpA/Prc
VDSEVIDEIASHVRYCYLDPSRADRMLDELSSRWVEYRELSEEQLAEKMTADLQELSGDRHFRLAAVPLRDLQVAAEERYKQFLPGAAENFGFRKVELLQDNIGLVEITALVPPEDSEETLRSAMRFLKHAAGLICDLRENRGGSAEMVAAVASYLLGPEPAELSGVMWHHTGEREQFYTDPAAAAFIFSASVPIALAVGPRTGSAAEALAYDLQSYKRATIVGEATRGAAHRVMQFDVRGSFTLTVPAGKVTNPITGGDWEGSGVRPDIAAPVEEAVIVAQQLLARSAR